MQFLVDQGEQGVECLALTRPRHTCNNWVPSLGGSCSSGGSLGWETSLGGLSLAPLNSAVKCENIAKRNANQQVSNLLLSAYLFREPLVRKAAVWRC